MAQTITVLGIDIAKLVFHVVGMDDSGTGLRPSAGTLKRFGVSSATSPASKLRYSGYAASNRPNLSLYHCTPHLWACVRRVKFSCTGA